VTELGRWFCDGFLWEGICGSKKASLDDMNCLCDFACENKRGKFSQYVSGMLLKISLELHHFQ